MVLAVSGQIAMAAKVATSATTTTFVDGVGDEVVYFFGFSVLLILLVVAWSSTSVGDRNGVIRAAVLVIERSRRRSRSSDRHQSTNVATTTTVVASETTRPVDTPATSVINGEGSSNARMSVTTTGTENVTLEGKESKTTVTAAGEVGCSSTTTMAGSTSTDDNNSGEGQIRVRLKFLNDTLKQVDARLEDQLGQFKRRHFGEELGENKVVRLIFNGQLLHRDQETLLHYGLFDNCVVHCHISTTPITSGSSAQSSSSEGGRTTTPSSSGASPSQPTAELDLSRLMLPLFGLILGLFWCCRIQYRQYFNATSTFALLCITGLFVVSVVAICMPTRSRHP